MPAPKKKTSKRRAKVKDLKARKNPKGGLINSKGALMSLGGLNTR